jgi:hypothetical protein
MFCWLCIIVYQYNETKFHCNRATANWHYAHAIYQMPSLQSCHSQLTLYARNIPNAVCAAAPEDEQVMLETCRGPWFSIKLNEKCITLVSLYWYLLVYFFSVLTQCDGSCCYISFSTFNFVRCGLKTCFELSRNFDVPIHLTVPVMYLYCWGDPVNLRNGEVGIRERPGLSVHIIALQVTQNAFGRVITPAEATGGTRNKT